MAKLFVSYSRRDSLVARKLIESFRSTQQDVWVDWESIPPAVDWLEQIFRGIEEADAFIFLISPDSKLLGVRTDGNEVAIYNIENRGLKTIKASRSVQSIAFSPDSLQRLAMTEPSVFLRRMPIKFRVHGGEEKWIQLKVCTM